MEKNELVALLDGLNWYQAHKWGWVKLLEVKLSPEITFVIKHHNYLKSSGEPSKFIDQWNVGFRIHGCESEVIFDSITKAKEYLLNQYSKLGKYLELIGKRKRLSERILPLQRKLSAYADQIFELAKTL